MQKRTVERIVRKKEIEGHVNPGPYLGAQRCTTREDDDLIVNAIRQNGFQSSRKVCKNTNKRDIEFSFVIEFKLRMRI